MPLHTSPWGIFAGQEDVKPTLHVPMVYESVATSPVRWEYQVLQIDPREEESPSKARLDALGEEGWSLVSVLERRETENRSYIVYYFVRQKNA